jgi:hypothetical protein
MGRPHKSGIEYFPFDVDFFTDEKIEFVSARFGMKGEIIVVRLLCKIYRNGYYIRFDDDIALLFARAVGDGCTAGLVKDVVKELLKRGFLNQDIFEGFGVLTSKGIQSRFFEAVGRYREIEVQEEYLLVEIHSPPKVQKSVFHEKTGVSHEKTPEKVWETPEKAWESAQSKVKESKEKEREREKPAARAAPLENFGEGKEEKTWKGSGKVVTGLGKPLEERAKDFYTAVAEHQQEHPPELLRAFYDYWSTPTASGIRMQFETIKPVFDIGFRLARWKEHEREFRQKADGTDTNRLYSYQEISTLVTSGKAKSTDDFERVERDGQSWWKRKVKGVA